MKAKKPKTKQKDTCCLCGVTYPSTGAELWENESASVKVPVGSVELVILDWKGPNERELCEHCYLKGGLELKLSSQELHDAHLQFAQHYAMCGELEKAKEAVLKSRMFKETAPCLALLANIELGLARKVAETLYRRALELDPEHFVSRENLRNLLGDNENGTANSDEKGFAQ